MEAKTNLWENHPDEYAKEIIELTKSGSSTDKIKEIQSHCEAKQHKLKLSDFNHAAKFENNYNYYTALLKSCATKLKVAIPLEEDNEFIKKQSQKAQ